MKEFIDFLNRVRRKPFEYFDREERRKYVMWLDILINDSPRLTPKDVSVICRYINRSTGFYLFLAGAYGNLNGVRLKYEGCMENLIFLLDYIMYWYSRYVPKKYIEKLYSKTLNIVRFCPFPQKPMVEYLIDTGLIEKIHFYLEYYYLK